MFWSEYQQIPKLDQFQPTLKLFSERQLWEQTNLPKLNVDYRTLSITVKFYFSTLNFICPLPTPTYIAIISILPV